MKFCLNFTNYGLCKVGHWSRPKIGVGRVTGKTTVVEFPPPYHKCVGGPYISRLGCVGVHIRHTHKREQEFDIINYDPVRSINDYGLALMSSYISRFRWNMQGTMTSQLSLSISLYQHYVHFSMLLSNSNNSNK